ncbi:MAG: hypothetical protein CYPHOPRED_001652 [Cyphobasidiales sp. Tagirdzhanova-0007]|nr:MAG: hypothetical protein CYPHOPRED_001652 [Cyphobasidiales sp. Tagirdzhanova-0007]
MPEVIIIGGGFSGLAMAVQLRRRLGMQDFLLIERSSSLGGVWANNRYPGVACDIPTALYSLSFAQEYWKNLFADGASIRDYAERVANQYHIVESNTLFQTEVVSARWKDVAHRWTVQVKERTLHGSKEPVDYVCKILISAVGNLSNPNKINIKGIEHFQGSVMHTGCFEEQVDLRKKHVVVLGNGCSATQLVPAIAPHVKSLTVFGPSKQWYLPRPSLPAAWLFNTMSKYTSLGQHLLRYTLFAACEEGFQAMHWKAGISYRADKEKLSAAYIRQSTPAKYHDDIIPDFAFGRKRCVFDNGFLRTLHRSNVEFYCEHVSEIVEDGIIRPNRQKVFADVIIAATGFQAQRYLQPIHIVGQNEQDLHEHMTAEGRGLSSYKGVFYSSFPNFATVYGPNSGTGHSSAIFTQECQVNMILKHLVRPILQEENVKSVAIKPEKEAEWQRWLRKEMSQTIWEQPENVGWYSDENGFCTTLYPRSQIHLWWSLMRTSSSDFIYKPCQNKSMYGSTKIFEIASGAVALFLLVMLLSLFLSLCV